MAAPKGNKFTEKWTEEEAKNFGELMISVASEQECYSITQVLMHIKKNHFTPGEIYFNLPSYLDSKFDVFINYKKTAEKIIEDRVYMAGLDERKNVTMAIAYLNARHKWRRNIDHTSDEKPLTNINVNLHNPAKKD